MPWRNCARAVQWDERGCADVPAPRCSAHAVLRASKCERHPDYAPVGPVGRSRRGMGFKSHSHTCPQQRLARRSAAWDASPGQIAHALSNKTYVLRNKTPVLRNKTYVLPVHKRRPFRSSKLERWKTGDGRCARTQPVRARGQCEDCVKQRRHGLPRTRRQLVALELKDNPISKKAQQKQHKVAAAAHG